MLDGKTDDIKPIGTGPYKLIDTKLGVYDKFEANEKHYAIKPTLNIS